MTTRSISPFALLFASTSAILGSGWLFSAYYTASIAGPASLLSWIIGGLMVVVVAFTFAELSAMLPLTGSSSRIPLYTHGTLASFVFAWMIWLSYAALAPTEVQAVIQYVAYFYPDLLHPNNALTHSGLVLAIALMLLISAINVFSLRWLLRCNNALTWLKIIIPVIISALIIGPHLINSHHLMAAGITFMPMGKHGVLSAIATGGIVFAFNGFKQACEMAGEAKHPHRSLPFAIIGSIVVCLFLYLLLQLAFLSMTPAHAGLLYWAHLHLAEHHSPFATILDSQHLHSMLFVLYIGAIVGPLAAALLYINSSSRSLYAISKNNCLPRFFQALNTQGNPIYAILLNFVLGIVLFLPLPGWRQMVSFLTSLMAITYAISPICLMALRKQLPNQHRPFRLPLATLWSAVAFYICTLLTYWSGWAVISKLSLAVFSGVAVLLCYRLLSPHGRTLTLAWRASIWLWPYFIGVTLFAYYGNFGGVHPVIPFGWDFALIAVFCVLILWLAQRYQLSPATTQAYLEQDLLPKEK